MLARDLLKFVLDRLEIEFAEMSPEEQQAHIEDYVNKTKDRSESLDIMTIEDVFAALKKNKGRVGLMLRRRNRRYCQKPC